MSENSSDKKLLNVYLTQRGSLRFQFEPGAEEMIEANHMHDLIGDVIAEFGENFKFKNRMHARPIDHEEGSLIIIPKGAIF